VGQEILHIGGAGIAVTQDDEDAVVVVRFRSFSALAARDLVCGAMVRSNWLREDRSGCPGSWLVCSVALGSPEALWRNGLPSPRRMCEGAPPVRSLPARAYVLALGRPIRPPLRLVPAGCTGIDHQRPIAERRRVAIHAGFGVIDPTELLGDLRGWPLINVFARGGRPDPDPDPDPDG